MQLFQIPVLICGLIIGAALGISAYHNLFQAKAIWHKVQPNRLKGAVHLALMIFDVIAMFAAVEVLGHVK